MKGLLRWGMIAGMWRPASNRARVQLLLEDRGGGAEKIEKGRGREGVGNWNKTQTQRDSELTHASYTLHPC